MTNKEYQKFHYKNQLKQQLLIKFSEKISNYIFILYQQHPNHQSLINILSTIYQLEKDLMIYKINEDINQQHFNFIQHQVDQMIINGPKNSQVMILYLSSMMSLNYRLIISHISYIWQIIYDNNYVNQQFINQFIELFKDLRQFSSLISSLIETDHQYPKQHIRLLIRPYFQHISSSQYIEIFQLFLKHSVSYYLLYFLKSVIIDEYIANDILKLCYETITTFISPIVTAYQCNTKNDFILELYIQCKSVIDECYGCLANFKQLYHLDQDTLFIPPYFYLVENQHIDVMNIIKANKSQKSISLLKIALDRIQQLYNYQQYTLIEENDTIKQEVYQLAKYIFDKKEIYDQLLLSSSTSLITTNYEYQRYQLLCQHMSLLSDYKTSYLKRLLTTIFYHACNYDPSNQVDNLAFISNNTLKQLKFYEIKNIQQIYFKVVYQVLTNHILNNYLDLFTIVNDTDYFIIPSSSTISSIQLTTLQLKQLENLFQIIINYIPSANYILIKKEKQFIHSLIILETIIMGHEHLSSIHSLVMKLLQTLLRKYDHLISQYDVLLLYITTKPILLEAIILLCLQQDQYNVLVNMMKVSQKKSNYIIYIQILNQFIQQLSTKQRKKLHLNEQIIAMIHQWFKQNDIDSFQFYLLCLKFFYQINYVVEINMEYLKKYINAQDKQLIEPDYGSIIPKLYENDFIIYFYQYLEHKHDFIEKELQQDITDTLVDTSSPSRQNDDLNQLQKSNKINQFINNFLSSCTRSQLKNFFIHVLQQLEQGKYITLHYQIIYLYLSKQSVVNPKIFNVYQFLFITCSIVHLIANKKQILKMFIKIIQYQQIFYLEQKHLILMIQFIQSCDMKSMMMLMMKLQLNMFKYYSILMFRMMPIFLHLLMIQIRCIMSQYYQYESTLAESTLKVHTTTTDKPDKDNNTLSYFQNMFHLMTRLYQLLGKSIHKKSINKYITMLLVEIIQNIAQYAIFINNSLLKEYLYTGIYNLMNQCDTYEYKQLNSLLTPIGKEIFKKLYSQYQRFYQYKG